MDYEKVIHHYFDLLNESYINVEYKQIRIQDLEATGINSEACEVILQESNKLE